MFNIQNITELVFICLSAFLGFLSAILVEWLYKRYEGKNSKKILLQGIYNELLNIEQDTKSLKDEFYYLSPLEKPFWESAISSGNISLIAESEIYPQILNIYTMVDAINRWENLKTQIHHSNGSFNKNEISNSITRHISDLSEEIKKMLTTLKKYNK
jgi:hypothetical protein